MDETFSLSSLCDFDGLDCKNNVEKCDHTLEERKYGMHCTFDDSLIPHRNEADIYPRFDPMLEEISFFPLIHEVIFHIKSESFGCRECKNHAFSLEEVNIHHFFQFKVETYLENTIKKDYGRYIDL